jgi:broad specificity phosphatase PhoE
VSATTLLLARHGQTVWHADNRYAGGDSDVDLTPTGVEQAHRLAAAVHDRGVDAVVVSPVRRARETAAPAAAALGLEATVVDDLREVTLAEVAAQEPDGAAIVERFRADPVAHPFPGAEPPTDAAHRCAAALRAVAAATPGGIVLVVAHNTLLRLGLCALIGLPIARYRDVFPRLDNAALTEIALHADPDRPTALLSLNVPCRPPADGS